MKSRFDLGGKTAGQHKTYSPVVQPFLKWPGGKRWLVPELIKIVGEYDYVTYREPFLGGGALFFGLRPKQSVLSDINSDLINTYRHVKYRAVALLEQLRPLPINQVTYDRLRECCPSSPLQRAVRFLYLNRTAFGGMYRLNQQGEFNVPFGGGERTTWNTISLSLRRGLCAAPSSLWSTSRKPSPRQRKAIWCIAIRRIQWRITTTVSSVITRGTSLGRIRNGYRAVAIRQQLAARSSL